MRLERVVLPNQSVQHEGGVVGLDQKSAKRAAADIARLPKRDVTVLRALHYYDDGNGFFCLDLNIGAETEEALDQAVREKLSNFTLGDVLPAAPAHRWMDFVRGECAQGRLIRANSRTGVVIVAVHRKVPDA